jgi:hypothetical protein
MMVGFVKYSGILPELLDSEALMSSIASLGLLQGEGIPSIRTVSLLVQGKNIQSRSRLVGPFA